MAALAPMPRARVITVTVVNMGDWRRRRRTCLKRMILNTPARGGSLAFFRGRAG